MPAWMPACVVSPGPLPHVRWQSVPSCLHSSAVKTVTSGPGPAGTPLSLRACVLVRVYGDTPAGTRLSVPIHGCTFVCTAVPWVPVCSWTCVCAGTHAGVTDIRVDIHEHEGCRGAAAETTAQQGPERGTAQGQAVPLAGKSLRAALPGPSLTAPICWAR